MSIDGLQLTKVIEIDRIINTSYQEFLPGIPHKQETHSSWEFIYVEQGKLCVYADEDRYVLESSETIFLAPMKEYCIESYLGEARAISFRFVVSGEFLRWDKKVFLMNYQQKYYLNEIINIGEQFLQTPAGALEEKNLYGQILKNTIELLILSIISSQQAKKKESSDIYHSLAQRKNITNDIIQYLNNKVGEPVKLQDIADRFSYSLSSIKRIFKKETGQSIIDYQNNIRIAEAKRLLENSNMSIQEISNFLGFANAGYFARSFKKREGISPSIYRKTVKNRERYKTDNGN